MLLLFGVISSLEIVILSSKSTVEMQKLSPNDVRRAHFWFPLAYSGWVSFMPGT